VVCGIKRDESDLVTLTVSNESNYLSGTKSTMKYAVRMMAVKEFQRRGTGRIWGD